MSHKTLDRLLPGGDPVLLDGAMGTALRERGWPAREPSLLANLDAPDTVSAVHRDYVAAGAAILHTNTFGAQLLTAFGPRRLRAVRAGAQLAREAAGGRAFVAGSLAAYDLAFEGPRLVEVVQALVEEGVDLLVFETCNQIHDAQVALEVRAKVAPHLPAVVCASTTDGSHEDGRRVAAVLALVAAAAPEVERGLNCCRGPHEAYKLALSLPQMPRWLKPSTGPPEDPVDDNVMAAFARAARGGGARFIGGCCGSNADTVRLMASALNG